MRKLLCVVVLPLTATILLSILATLTLSSSVPRDMGNSSQWTDFASDVSVRVRATDTPTRVVFLMCIHAMHIYMCLPMLHITKVLYGYWLGVGLGWFVCCAWEMFLFFIYISAVHKEHNKYVLEFTSRARRDDTLFRENVLFAMSSLPLQASASLLQFGDVTRREFMTANSIVTAVMSMKNVLCGALLASSPSAQQIAVLAALLAFSTVLPTISTVYVSSKSLLAALYAHGERQALLDIEECEADYTEDTREPDNPKRDHTEHTREPDDLAHGERQALLDLEECEADYTEVTREPDNLERDHTREPDDMQRDRTEHTREPDDPERDHEHADETTPFGAITANAQLPTSESTNTHVDVLKIPPTANGV